jgi:hypothetical protein
MPAAWSLAKILDPPGFATVAARAGAILLLLCAIPARADDSVFAVSRILVDETASSATEARELALTAGHRQAWERLVRRLVLLRDQAAAPALSASRIAELVSGFEVVEEKASNVRYLAELRMDFAPDAVRRLLRDSGVPFAETSSKTVVVLPVMRRAGAVLLWDAVNTWLAAWRGLPPADGLVPMVVPKGELADIADIGPEQALAGDEARIAAIARRYGAADGLLAYAVLAQRGDGASVQATVSRLGAGTRGRTLVRAFESAEGEDEAALLARAAAEIRLQVEESWKRDNILRFDDRRTLVAIAPLTDASAWVALRRRVDGVAFIERSEILALSRRQATLRLSYIGDEEQLALALAQHDLTLARGATSWEIRLRGAGADTAPVPMPAPAEIR